MANYLIIGGDGKEYGPVTEADVRQWLAEGRLNAESRAKAESDAEFRPLATFPEFASTFAAGTPATIAPLKSSAASDFLQRDYELDLGGCISRGYQLLKENFSLLFVSTLVFGAIEGLIAVLGIIPFVGPLLSIVNLVISGPLIGGVFWVSLCAIRGEPAEVGDVFAGFRRCFGQLFLGRLVPALLAGLCVIPIIIAAVVVLLPSMAHNQPPDPHKLLILIPVVLICLIPMVYLQTCWLFTLPLIIDKQMDFGAAMKASWKMVNKHWWQVFGLSILIGLVNLVGALACLVGLLFTVPIGFAALMYAYETIFGDQKN
jgi:uncharacterized membrane protein